MGTFRAAGLIARKDLLRRIRDRTAIVTAIVLPFALAYIFSLTLAGVDEGFSATYVIVDRDGGDIAGSLLETLASIDGVDVRDAASAADAEALVDDGDAAAAFVIPQGFSDAVRSGTGARVELALSAESTIGALVAEAVGRSFAARLDAISVAVSAASAAGGPGVDPAGLAERAQAIAPAATIADAGAEDRTASTTTFFAIGMAVFFLFFAVEFGVRGLLEEREEGTLARLLVAPIPASSVLAGKALASFGVGLISTSLLVVATTVLLDARWGDPFGVAVLVVAGVLTAVAVTALVSTFARSAAQAGAYASIVAVVGGLLGGTFFPISQAPGLLASIRFLSPQGWLMEGFQSLSAGEGLAGAWPAIAGTIAIGLVCAAVAWRRAWTLVAR